MHEDFLGILSGITPRQKAYDTVVGILREIWDEKQKSVLEDRHDLQQRLTRCEQALEGFLKDAQKASPLLKKELYAAAEKVGLDKKEIEEELSTPSQDSASLESDFQSITRFIRSPYNLWKANDAAKRSAVQKLVFNGPITYVAKESFRNVRYALPFRLFSEFDEDGEGLVELTPALRKELLAGMETLAEKLRFSSFC